MPPAPPGGVASQTPRRKSVVAVGAHPDDIELGCGGTLRAHVIAGDRVVMLVMTDGAKGPGLKAEVRRAEQIEAARRLGAEIRWIGYPDGMLASGHEAITIVEDAIEEVGADIVYTHYPHDSHQDHRATAEVSVSAARHVPQVLHYESPTSLDFEPRLYVGVTPYAEAKLNALEAHGSQTTGSRQVDLESIRALMRVRGFAAKTQFAEAFYPRRFVVDIGVSPARAVAPIF
ncbi:PIG-L deacetylase family protein [Streptoverticillium reticulum]|uniref:PIG-L deacetylase family protein n=1 Tax=Streptoverticillium reticulum TaxID=1433415 RepID=UPI0039BF97DF